jgi:hypothetical protein
MSGNNPPMSRQSNGKRLAFAVLVATILGAGAPSAQAAWGVLFPRPPWTVRRTPPDLSWLNDVPERPAARSRGKVAVFVFRGDDVYEPVRAAVVRTLRRRGLNVTAALRPVDSVAQYRELSYALNLAVFVDGELDGEGARQSARVQLRSGVTGQRIAAARFSGPTQKIVGDIGRTLWTRVGPATMRACTSAARPRQREREPMRIDAGAPADDLPIAARSD